jgi:hypothetical protein
MQTLDYDLVYGITAFWHAEVFDCATRQSVHWTAGFPDRKGAMAAAEAFLAAQAAEEEPA